MKVVILAAGKGTRLRPYTKDRPKCMVEINGKALLYRQLEVIQAAGIKNEDIAIVGGYLKDRLSIPNITILYNEHYASTNMVSTLFCAEHFMKPEEDLLICYGDIVYESQVLASVISTEGEVVLGADLEWKKLWALRMEEPLSDAETFKIKNGRMLELGKKPVSYDEVQAQYMGLIRIRADKVKDLVEFYHAMDKDAFYDDKDFNNMYMTSFIQALIDNGWDIRPALVSGGWLEVDSAEDLELYESLAGKEKSLSFLV